MGINAIRDFLVNFELDHTVENWEYDKTDLWPIFRTLFYNECRDILQGIENAVPIDWRKPKPNHSVNHIRRVLTKLKSKFIRRKNQKSQSGPTLPNVDFLFFGSWYFRTSYQGKYINKYFDSIIRYLRENHQIGSYIIEYLGVQKMEEHLSQIEEDIINLDDFSSQVTPVNIYLEKDKLFIEFFEKFYDEFKDDYFQGLNNILSKKINRVFSYKRLFKNILDAVKPRYAICQTFFNEQMFGMVAAAKEIDIVTIDLGHGYPLNENNIVYNKYMKVPRQGYNCLPEIFWVWDNHVLRAMQSGWLNRQNHHRAYVIGNPWLANFISNKSVRKKYEKPFVLYTTSTNFPDEKMLALIRRTQARFQWWIRVHPSIKGSLKELEVYLNNNNINNYNLSEANHEPLPQLLLNCELHISNFSSSIYESYALGNIPFIIDEEGEKAYKPLVDSHNVKSVVGLTENEIVQEIESLDSRSARQNKLEKLPQFAFEVDLLVKNLK